MKLNHLILVICTGILVGFSACKKDPFTEKDAIEAQKELLTLKNGYDLALKNIDLAIQKSADETAIAIAKLNNQATSDLAKQYAMQQLAQMQASLENDRKVLLWNDSVNRILQDKSDQRVALMNATGGYKNFDISVKDNAGEVVAGATIRVLPANSTTFLNVTTNADGIARFTNLIVFPRTSFYVAGPTSAAKVYARTIETYNNLEGTKNATLYYYDKSKTAKLSGTAYAAIDLTDDDNELAGAGILVTATNKLVGQGGPTSDEIKIELSALSDASSKYSIDLPLTTNTGLGNWKVTATRRIIRYQKGFVNWKDGDNLYQVLPSINDSLLVRLRTGWGGDDNFEGATNYFLSLPDEDAEGYAMTLTDPYRLVATMTAIAPGVIWSILGGGINAPDGTQSTPYQDLTVLLDDSTAFDGGAFGGIKLDADAFILNNSWLYASPTQATEYWYELPILITPDSGNYNNYIAQDQATKDQIAADFIADFILTGGNPTAVWTPAITYDTVPVPDTLAVDLVDLSGWWMEEAPELSVAIAADALVDEDLSHGKLVDIFIEVGNEVGMFNIVDVLFPATALYEDDVTVMWTNRDPNPGFSLDETTDGSGNTVPGFSGSFTSARVMDIYYGTYSSSPNDIQDYAWMQWTIGGAYYYPVDPFSGARGNQTGSKIGLPSPNKRAAE